MYCLYAILEPTLIQNIYMHTCIIYINCYFLFQLQKKKYGNGKYKNILKLVTLELLSGDLECNLGYTYCA